MTDNLFGSRLNSLLIERNICPRDFATSQGVSISTVYNWLNGLVPSVNRIDRIAEELHVSRNYLLTQKEKGAD